MLFEEDFFCVFFVEIGNGGDNQEFLNEGETFVFAFVHDVLLGSAPKYSLQKDDGYFSFGEIFGGRGFLFEFFFAEACFVLLDVHVGICFIVGSAGSGDDISECFDVVADYLIFFFLWF